MNTLFNNTLNRLNLLSIDDSININEVNIYVHRNHSFEIVASVINKFLDFSNYKANFIYSDYDDSFTFDNSYDNVSLHIIWIDVSRYKNIDLHSWLKDRIEYLKSVTTGEIIVYHTGDIDLSKISIENILIVNSNDIKNILSDATFDLKKQSFSGTRYSSKACLYIARELGLKYLPSLLSKTYLKCIILDLDNTLYEGVLGEDGYNNIKLFYNLQKRVKELKESGFFIAISSKNELSDVKEMFEKRKDFILKWDDISAYSIGWHSKSDGIKDIIKKLNIGFDSVLFIDDNIGEIEWVKMNISKIHCMQTISEDYSINILNYYPRLYKRIILEEDKIRTNDIKANNEREILHKEMSQDEYFIRLKMKLSYEINNHNDIDRISELLNKTNQFIFNYKRYSVDDIKKIMLDKNYAILSICLSDKLSDSGIISIVVASKSDDNTLIIEDLCISCRALGRHIEDIIILNAFSIIKKYLNTNEVLNILFKSGERNNPAKKWLEVFSNSDSICTNKNTQITINNIDYRNINTDSVMIEIKDINYEK